MTADADTLRHAAGKIREDVLLFADWARPFLLSTADWLDACAMVLDVSPDATKAHALTVAENYLAGAATDRPGAAVV